MTLQPIGRRIRLPVTILGQAYSAMIDTGAEVSFIGKSVVEDCRRNQVPYTELKEQDGVLADGRTVPIDFTYELTVSLGPRRITAIFNGLEQLIEDVVFGMDILATQHFRLDLRTQQVWLGSEELLYRKENKKVALCSIQTAPLVMTDQEQNRLEQFLEEELPLFNAIEGTTPLITHEIRLLDSEPIKQRYRPINPKMQEIMNNEVDEMLATGVIEPAESPWSSPIVLVRKKDNKYRFCIDFQKVNEVSRKDAYPLPFINAILDKLRHARYISTIDLKNGYWQVPLAQASKPITAFTVPGRGLFQFRVMPFGLHSAAATFQRLVDRLIGQDLEPYCFAYLDDIIITGKSFEHHLALLKEVFRRLRQANLRLNPEKCQFGRKSLKYLGHLVTSEGIRTDPDKVSAIVDLAPPTNLRGLRRFLGMASWYRRYIEGFSKITAPLNRLLKKGQRWKWTPEQDQAFCRLKQCLTEAPVLTCPDFEKPFILQTDASDLGLGVALTQHVEGNDKVIAYASRSLTSCEKAYSTTEKECLAIVWGIEKMRPYLEGYHFTVLTDHQSLKWLRTLKSPSGRLARWQMSLQQYSFDVKYRKGALNKVADALSRDPATSDSDQLENRLRILRGHPKNQTPDETTGPPRGTLVGGSGRIPLTGRQLDTGPAEEEEDPLIRQLLLIETPIDCNWYHRKKQEVAGQPENHPDYCIKNDKLYRHFWDLTDFKENEMSDPWKLCVPKFERKAVLEENHDAPTAGHLGIARTAARIAARYYWPGMFREIAQYVRSCTSCQQHKPAQQQTPGKMQPSINQHPWETVSSDLVGPLPRSSKGNCYLVMFQDRFTKWVQCKAIRQASGKAVTRALYEEIITRFGCPKTVITDNGTQYTGGLFRKLLTEMGIKHRLTPPYTPQANPVERANKTMKTMIAQYCEQDQKKWDEHLPEFMFAVNTARHSSTGYSPAFLNFGREPEIPSVLVRDNSQPTPDTETTNDLPDHEEQAHVKTYVTRLDKMKEVFEFVRINLARAFTSQSHYYNLRRREWRCHVGDLVMKKEHHLSSAAKNFAAKLAPKYSGPYTVLRVISPVVYDLKSSSGKIVKHVHVKDLKAAHQLPVELPHHDPAPPGPDVPRANRDVPEDFE